jgi:hypothetical protein
MVEDKLSTILDVGWQVADVIEGRDIRPHPVEYHKIRANSYLTKPGYPAVSNQL